MQPTYGKRAVAKRSLAQSVVAPVVEVAKDIGAGFGELKRQMGTAVNTVRSGYQKIRSSLK